MEDKWKFIFNYFKTYYIFILIFICNPDGVSAYFLGTMHLFLPRGLLLLLPHIEQQHPLWRPIKPLFSCREAKISFQEQPITISFY